MKEKMNRVAVLVLVVVLLVIVIQPRTIAREKFTQTFIYRIGGSPLSSGDENILSKYDVVTCSRRCYDDIGGDTWGLLRSLNPEIKIYLYQLTRASFADADSYDLIWLSNLARWNISRGHSMGSLYGDNPELILLDENGDFIINPYYPREILHDVGSADYQNYWIEATIHDILDQPWRADGVFGDITTIGLTSLSAIPVKYPTDEDWSVVMNEFINAAASALHNENTRLSCNRTGVKTEFGYEQWIELDNSPNPPDAILEEGSFAVKWGTGDVQFYSETMWRRQVDIMAQIHNSNVQHQSHSDLPEGGSGIDNYGKPVIFWDILWYSLASFHLGKSYNSYFGYSESYNIPVWYDEYDYIDLGDAIGSYEVTNYNGSNIYSRKFERGYIFVNPTPYDVSLIQLPVTCKQLTHDNFMDDPATISDTTTINLKSHRATFLLSTGIVTYDGDPIMSTDGMLTANVELVATLRDAEGNPVDIDDEEVGFTLTAEGVGAISVPWVFTYDGVASSIVALEPAIYVVDVTVPGLGLTTSAIAVVYNPEGGFATGGGWIVPVNDGLNSYPNVRANFGFNSKYKKGASAGHLEFRYSDGFVDLKSDSVDLLVITGGKIAQFKGYATVNGEPGHWYFVKAIDNGEPGNQDTFEIKVWAPGTDPDVDEHWHRAGGTLQGGNIVVHK